MDNEKITERKANPRATSNFLSSLFLLYLVPVFYISFKKDFTENDLFATLKEDESNHLGENLEESWKRYNKRHKKWCLHLALFNNFGCVFFFTGFLLFIKEVARIVFIPYQIGKLVSYFSQTTEEISAEEAYWYTGGLILCLTLERIIAHPVMLWNQHLAMKMRVACCGLIYRKILRLSKSALAQTTVGHVINLISNDLSRFDMGFNLIHYTWISPIQAVLAIVFLYLKIGSACFMGVGFLVILLPVQLLVAKKTATLRQHIAVRTDERVRLMNEIISGIQVIKMYTWEYPFAKLIAQVRSKEVKTIRLLKIMWSLSDFESYATRTAIFISLVAFYLMGQQITAEIVFSLAAIFEVTNHTISSLFEIAVRNAAEANVSIHRINLFLNRNELPNKMIMPQPPTFGIQTETKSSINLSNGNVKVSPKVVLQNISANWDNDNPDNSLSNISCNINESQLFAVIGPVGSGKSSLFNVLLHELPICKGRMDIEGKVSYSSQEPWLFSASVRQNILFGDIYDQRRYRKVCKVCSLESDFQQLPHGDKTLVGERGKTLSGGQKARISLARCIYKKADIYLLDDPLSAVDTNVGKKLFNECIRNFLQDKICILITHQLQYLKNADKILILNDGTSEGLGTYDELQKNGLDFAKLLGEMQTNEEDEEQRKLVLRQISVSSEKSDGGELQDDENAEEPLLEKEKLTTGVVTSSTYTRYLLAGGNYFVLFLLIICFFLFEAVSRGSDYFVTYWVNTEQYFLEQNSSMAIEERETIRNTLIYEYAAIIIATIALSIFHQLFFFIILSRASINLHNYIFEELMKAKMKFFNTNPSGRILNRFSKDLGVMDEYLPNVMCSLCSIAMVLLGTIILTSALKPLLLPPALGLLFLFYLVRIVYIKTSRSVKRIEGIARSPILNQVTATLNGLSTIRAFAAERILIDEFNNYQDVHSSAYLLFTTTSRAFGFWLDLICGGFIGLVIIALLILSEDMRGGDLGLIITQYMGLMGTIQFGMRQWSELENNMTSVERVLEYTKLDNELEREKKIELTKDWPNEGKLEFRNVSMKYSENDLPVLKKINFLILSGEKVGIVGRTGAGKSSIIISLFQLYEIDGAIFIDDVDTTKLPLNVVRSHVSIIPQEPILFGGTMRKNLDPFDQYSDDVLWSALEQVELKDVVAEMPQGLHTNISEGGSNFSVGQRQLVCLARAIVRSNRILVLDEATANVDPYTDALIQKTIRKKFAHCTVLTIAHRLHTVMDSDKILLMDAGQIVEFDSPHVLLQKSGGVFKSMIQSTGLSTAKNLKQIASKAHEESKNK